VEVDDGGLSLSSDDSAPLTAPREKAAPDAADDGGLSLSANSDAPLTAPKAKANPDAADDGGLTAAEPASSETVGSDDVARSAATSEEKQPAEVASVQEPAAPEQSKETPVDKKPVDKPVARDIPKPAPDTSAPANETAPATGKAGSEGAAGSGLVLPGQIGNSVVPDFTPEEELADASASAADSLREALPSASNDAAPVTDQGEPPAEQSTDANTADAAMRRWLVLRC